jgi:hypothetical protein
VAFIKHGVRSVFKATFLYINPFLVVSLLEVGEPPAHTCTEGLVQNVQQPTQSFIFGIEIQRDSIEIAQTAGSTRLRSSAV